MAGAPTTDTPSTTTTGGTPPPAGAPPSGGAAPAPVQGSLLGMEPKPAAPAAATPPAEAPKPGEPAKDAPPAPADIELKLPEGFKADDKLLGDFKALAKETGLDAAKAQKLFDLHAGALAAAEQARIAADEKQATDWQTAARADKEYGGANFDGNLEVGLMAIQRLGTPALREWLNQSGAGNHPELLRFAVRVGKLISEDSLGEGARANARQVPDAEAELRTLYPTMYEPKE